MRRRAALLLAILGVLFAVLPTLAADNEGRTGPIRAQITALEWAEQMGYFHAEILGLQLFADGLPGVTDRPVWAVILRTYLPYEGELAEWLWGCVIDLSLLTASGKPLLYSCAGGDVPWMRPSSAPAPGADL